MQVNPSILRLGAHGSVLAGRSEVCVCVCPCLPLTAKAPEMPGYLHPLFSP